MDAVLCPLKEVAVGSLPCAWLHESLHLGSIWMTLPTLTGSAPTGHFDPAVQWKTKWLLHNQEKADLYMYSKEKSQ